MKSGGLVLAGINTDDLGPNADTWEKIARKLRSREMPPATAPRPDIGTAVAFAGMVVLFF